MAATKSKINTTAVTVAQERVRTLEGHLAAVRSELVDLRSEHADLEQAYSAGEAVDVDRLGDLADTAIPRREARLAQLEKDLIPEARRAARQAELEELAAKDADGITGRWEAYRTTVAESERKVSEALREARQAAAEWSTFIEGVADTAKAAKLSHNVPGDAPIRTSRRAGPSSPATSRTFCSPARTSRPSAPTSRHGASSPRPTTTRPGCCERRQTPALSSKDSACSGSTLAPEHLHCGPVLAPSSPGRGRRRRIARASTEHARPPTTESTATPSIGGMPSSQTGSGTTNASAQLPGLNRSTRVESAAATQNRRRSE